MNSIYLDRDDARRCGFLLVVLVCFGLASGVATADTGTIQGPELPYADTSASFPERTLDQNVFRPGERLKLRVTYLGMTAGYIKVRVDRQKIHGRDLYALNLNAYTAGPVEWFYTARDRLTSYMDVQGLFSWGYDFFKNHQGEKEETRVRYYHDRGVFKENGSREGTIPTFTQDLLSAIYYLRTQDLAVGQEYQFPVHSSDRSYRLTIEVRETDRVATMNGWRDAYELVPTFEEPTDRDEAFEHVQEVQGVRLWVSQDKYKVPLKVSLPATFGHVYGYLTQFKPGK